MSVEWAGKVSSHCDNKSQIVDQSRCGQSAVEDKDILRWEDTEPGEDTYWIPYRDRSPCLSHTLP
jgi:hypothetical protein